MDAASWKRLCSLLDDDPQLVPGVLEALDGGADPWEALLDGLDDGGALAFLDVADTGMELADALAQLPRVFRLQPDLDEVTDTDDLGDALRAADGVLAGTGHRLVRLEQSDAEALALVVVPVDAVAEVGRLGTEAGRTAVPPA